MFVMPDAATHSVAPAVAQDEHRTATDFLAAVGGDRLVREMVALFVAYTPNRIAAMHSAAERRDTRGLCREAFALRAAAMQLGLSEVERVAASIECASLTAPAHDASDLLADLVQAYDAAVSRLQSAA